MDLELNVSLLRTEIGLAVLAALGILLDLFLPRRADRGKWIANAAILGLGVLMADLAAGWGRFGAAFSGGFIQDGASFFFKLLFLVTGIFVIHMAREYEGRFARGRGEFILLILFALTGMSFLVSANEFLLFFVALETLTISLTIITAYLREDERSIEAAVKFLILGAVSTGVFLYGLSFIYGATGSTSFIEIQRAVDGGAAGPAFAFGMTLVLAALAFKCAVFPFFFWVPDVYEGAPAPITAFLAIGSKTAGFAALVRLFMTVFMPELDRLVPILSAAACLTILYGNLGAIPQKNIKRMLAYSSIGHAGYLLLGLAAFENGGKEAVLFYLLSYLFSTAGAFLVVVWISARFGAETIADYAGLSKKSPVLAAGMLVALFSLAGMPPLGGFLGKFLILSAAVKSGLMIPATIGLVNVAVSLYYYLGVVRTMYVDAPADASPLAVGRTQKIFQYASIAGIFITGIFPGPFIRLIDAAFFNFLRF